jgi:uracil-DNA glycosylase
MERVSVEKEGNFIIVSDELYRELTIYDIFHLVDLGDWRPIFDSIDKRLKTVSDGIATSNISFLPDKMLIPAPFLLTPFNKMEVVIFGQDPYPEPDKPMGLAFSIKRGRPLSQSLKMMFEELQRSLGVPTPTHGSLIKWARQGILLLNATWTVEPYKSGGEMHKQAWKTVVPELIKLITRSKPLIIVLWGKPAKDLEKDIEGKGHYILRGPHPVAGMRNPGSDISFIGCNHFVLVNEELKRRGKAEIDWSI